MKALLTRRLHVPRLSDWSITSRVIFLSVVLLVFLIATNLFLSKRLSENEQALVESGRYLEGVTEAYKATTSFGDVKYWLADLAASLLVRAEFEARDAANALALHLQYLARYAPEIVPDIRDKVDALVETALLAVEAYEQDERVRGNAIMATARRDMEAIDEQLAELVARVEVVAGERRAAAIASAARAVNLSLITVLTAVLVCMVLTFVLIRSIAVPLRRVMVAMSGITRGDMAVTVPELGRDEIGAMAHTLSLFRDSLIERDRLAAERSRAEAEQRQAQIRLADALATIQDGVAVFNTDDRLIVCNRAYEDLYAGIETVAPGMSYVDIIRSAAEKGVIAAARGRIEAWLAERVAQHRNPDEPYEQQRTSGQWLRISERRTHDGGIVAVLSDITTLKVREAALRDEQRRTAIANRMIMDSLHYASRIQNAMLPAPELLARFLGEHFVIWQPRDIVGGDFYWFHRTNRGYYVIVGDCTGHGVPGAFMTLIVCGLVDRHLRTLEEPSPGELLAFLHRDLQQVLGQDTLEGETDDGLEAGVCFVDEARSRMTFAGARFSLLRAANGAVDEIKGDKGGIGYRRVNHEQRFTDIPVDVVDREVIYLATDGLIDQIGGHKRRSFGKRRLREFIAAYKDLPLAEQEGLLLETMKRYQGDEARRDDVSVLAIRLPGRKGH